MVFVMILPVAGRVHAGQEPPLSKVLIGDHGALFRISDLLRSLIGQKARRDIAIYSIAFDTDTRPSIAFNPDHKHSLAAAKPPDDWVVRRGPAAHIDRPARDIHDLAQIFCG
jgi:hypothetical protein